LGTESRLKGLGIEIDKRQSKQSLIKELRNPVVDFNNRNQQDIAGTGKLQKVQEHISEEVYSTQTAREEPEVVSPANSGTLETVS
jgi:hypothetical protein